MPGPAAASARASVQGKGEQEAAEKLDGGRQGHRQLLVFGSRSISQRHHFSIGNIVAGMRPWASGAEGRRRGVRSQRRFALAHALGGHAVFEVELAECGSTI
jgi:hypothetical protein